jgi:hypothetical protein
MSYSWPGGEGTKVLFSGRKVPVLKKKKPHPEVQAPPRLRATLCPLGCEAIVEPLGLVAHEMWLTVLKICMGRGDIQESVKFVQDLYSLDQFGFS